MKRASAMEFEKVAILGGGLLGGSLALALRDRTGVALWGRRAETVDEARARGVDGATNDLDEAVDGADLVVLSVPVGAMPDLVERSLEAGLRADALVTDVGSVKRAVHGSLGPMLKEAGVAFIGGHPMAGSEERGMAAAREDLFSGSACLLTDDEAVGDPLAGKLERFWAGLGCRVSWTDAAAHDELVARISHFPHAMAAATALVGLTEPDAARFGGGGLRDTTRVASGDPAMWAEIFMENREALAGAVAGALGELGEMLAMLRGGDHEAVRAWLERARARHQEAKRAQSGAGDFSR